MSAEDISFEKLGRAEIGRLCRHFHVRRLDLFGSSLSPRFDPRTSDFDFLVEFEPLAPAQYAQAYFGLREALQGVFGREIDLVTEASLANPYFRQRVESERQTLFPGQ